MVTYSLVLYGNTIRFPLRSVEDDRLFTLWLVHVKPRKWINMLKLSDHSPALKGLSSPSQGNDSPDKHTHTAFHCQSPTVYFPIMPFTMPTVCSAGTAKKDKAQHYSLSFSKDVWTWWKASRFLKGLPSCCLQGKKQNLPCICPWTINKLREQGDTNGIQREWYGLGQFAWTSTHLMSDSHSASKEQ